MTKTQQTVKNIEVICDIMIIMEKMGYESRIFFYMPPVYAKRLRRMFVP